MGAWSSDRLFFSLAALWFVVVTLVGFSPTFYLRSDPAPLPTHQIVHGALYSAWMLLFLVQAVLITAGRRWWHVRLGVASLLLLVSMIPAGFYVVLAKYAAGLKTVDDAGFNLTLLTLGFGLAFSGLAYRRRPFVHKRLMLFATMVLTVAAADRVAMVLGLEDVRVFRKVLAVVPVVALIGYDAIARRPVLLSVAFLATVWLVIWYVVSDLLFLQPMGEACIQILTKLIVW